MADISKDELRKEITGKFEVTLYLRYYEAPFVRNPARYYEKDHFRGDFGRPSWAKSASLLLAGTTQRGVAHTRVSHFSVFSPSEATSLPRPKNSRRFSAAFFPLSFLRD